MKKMNWFPVVVFAAGPKCSLPLIPSATGAVQFQVALPPVVSSVHSAFTKLAGCRVDIFGHMWAIELSPKLPYMRRPLEC